MRPGQGNGENRPTPLTPAALARGLRALLAGRPQADGLWLFGYGALMWRPGDDFTAVERVRLDGRRRSFCTWSRIARGSPGRPGLGLGLVPGGTVEGLALWLPAAAFDDAMPGIWRQEMYVGLYRPEWLQAEALDGGPARPVLAFVAEPEHPQFAADLPLQDQAAAIGAAVGENGSCREYLEQTVAALRRWRLKDAEMEELMRLVDR